jgi:hypothetical protein
MVRQTFQLARGVVAHSEYHHKQLFVIFPLLNLAEIIKQYTGRNLKRIEQENILTSIDNIKDVVSGNIFCTHYDVTSHSIPERSQENRNIQCDVRVDDVKPFLSTFEKNVVTVRISLI